MNVAHSHISLIAENRRLREQLAALREQKQAPISVDPDEGRVTINDYQTDEFTVHRLEAQSDGFADMAQTMSQVDRFLGPQSGSLPNFSKAMQKTVHVDELKLTVPFDTINKALPKIAGPQMREAGIRELRVGPGQKPNEVVIEGRVKKFLEVGFDAVGEMSATPSGKTKFVLKKTCVGGLPMPNFLSALVTQVFAGDSMRKFGVEQNGSEFRIDPNKLMPPNIDTQITDIGVDRSGFHIEGGKPQTAIPAEKTEDVDSNLSAWNYAPMMP